MDDGELTLKRILTRARSDRRRMIAGFVGIWSIAAFQIAIAARWASGARNAVDAAAPLLIVTVATIVVAASHYTARGQFARSDDTPAALLDALERRHAARLRLMRWIPWLTGGVLSAAIALTAVVMVAERRVDASTLAFVALCCVATVAYSRFVMMRVGAKIAKELRDIARAREMLG